MLYDLRKIAIYAGEEILKIYNDPKKAGQFENKDNNSPLTLADTASNAVIIKELKKRWPEIPILSEEEREVPYDERKKWNRFWCVDPLDGTKEFIKHNGEFTVNIALIENGYPVLGVIYAPVTNTMYTGDVNAQQAFKNEQKIKSSDSIDMLIAVGSRSHASNEDDLLKKYPITDTIVKGSSLKFCMIAEGAAEIYYRAGPTMEWDTAAGQAIVEAAGGKVQTLTGKRFNYNKENLLNGSFLVLGRGL